MKSVIRKCPSCEKKAAVEARYITDNGFMTSLRWVKSTMVIVACKSCGRDSVMPVLSRRTKRALDGAKAPRKSKRSTGSPRK